MNSCPNCSVEVYQKNCPLCGRAVNDDTLLEVEYPSYKFSTSKRREFVWKVLLFLAISIVLVTIFVNVFTYSLLGKIWSLTVCASLGFIIMASYLLKSKKSSFGGKTLSLFIAFSIFIILIDVANGYLKWSTTYVIPFMTVVVAVFFTIFAAAKKNNFKEYFGYLLATAFIGVCPIALYLFRLSNELWSSMVATLACIIIAVGLFIFSKQSLKDELKKRFHT